MVRVVAFQISETSVPNDVRVRPLYDQTVDGIDAIAEASEVEAAFTVVFVFELIALWAALTADVMPDVCVLVFALIFAASDVEAVVTSD